MIRDDIPRYNRALARVLEGYTDLVYAKIGHKEGIESRSLYHTQQCVEKSLKACMSKINAGEIMSHTVLKLFQERVMEKIPIELQEKFGDLEDIIWVEERWVDTRYNEFNGETILLPTLRFSPEDAETGIKVAEQVLMASIDCVNFLFDVNLPKDYEKLKEVVKQEIR
ncbi:unnamed protein product, partial [marine sediment metagenome]